MVERKGRNGGTLRSMEKGDPTLPGAGRPKGSLTISKKYQAFLESMEEIELEEGVGKAKRTVRVKVTREEALMFRLYKIAHQGDATANGEAQGVSIAAIREILDRAYGKATQPIEQETTLKIQGGTAMTQEQAEEMLKILEASDN